MLGDYNEPMKWDLEKGLMTPDRLVKILAGEETAANEKLKKEIAAGVYSGATQKKGKNNAG